MNLSIGNFDIEYTEDDLEYIEEIKKIIILNQDKILKYFNLKKLSQRVNIKFWNDLVEYRNYFNKILSKFNKTVPEWEVARATSSKNRIDILSLCERRKCKKHENDDFESILKVVIHEFVHICTFEYNNHRMLPIWFLEGLATNLANQFNEIKINCSLDEIRNGNASYVNYYSLVRYLLENNDKDYILSLMNNKEDLDKLLELTYFRTLEMKRK